MRTDRRYHALERSSCFFAAILRAISAGVACLALLAWPAHAEVATVKLTVSGPGQVAKGAIVGLALGGKGVAPIVWTSSDAAIASVDAYGDVTGVALGGPVVISAVDATGRRATHQVAVVALTLSGPDLVCQGERRVLTASGAGKPFTWSTSDANIATVAAGQVTGVRPGKVTITVTDANGATAAHSVTVVRIARLEYRIGKGKFAPIPSRLLVAKDTTVEFKAIIEPEGARWPEFNPIWRGPSSAAGGEETVSVMFDAVSDNSTDYKTVIAGGFTARVLVYAVTAVESWGPLDKEWQTAGTKIAAGGYPDAPSGPRLHTARIRLTAAPVPNDAYSIAVPVQLSNGQAHRGTTRHAVLTIGGQTISGNGSKTISIRSADGRIEGSLRSANRSRTCAVTAGDASVEVEFAWDTGPRDWKPVKYFYEDEFAPATSTLTLADSKVPLVGHDMNFYVVEVSGWRLEDGVWRHFTAWRSSTNDLSQFARFYDSVDAEGNGVGDGAVQGNRNGEYTAQLIVYSSAIWVIDEILTGAADEHSYE